ncbi:hypothetical protein OG381_17305 [Streptomyces sp. NBC_00490]|uniref:hypothetical protein n=1 Tax=Streptomyces sp. NBC_00490 TaxID=2903657 RepID=UPI002E16DFE5
MRSDVDLPRRSSTPACDLDRDGEFLPRRIHCTEADPPKEGSDKTGGGSYGTHNNVGIARTPEGTPLLLAPDPAKALVKALG